MKPTPQTNRNRHPDCCDDPRELAEEEQHGVEQDPAVERGERIAIGKAIARAGKKTGFVPGAQSDQEGSSTSERR